MDTQQQTFSQLTSLHHPAQLWIGSPGTLQNKVEKYLQQLWCTNNTCGLCTVCTQIVRHQHHQLLWIEPEKGYTLDLVDQISEKICYKLDAGQQFFFVLARADTLNLASGNRLLKAIEEPPAGYHFILLAHRIDMILPTIRSRCMVHQWDTELDPTLHKALYEYFTSKKVPSPIEFSTFIDSTPISEYQSMQVIDTLLTYWISVYKKTCLKDAPNTLDAITNTVTHLRNGLQQPPMPGSTKLFWKNLFLQIYG